MWCTQQQEAPVLEAMESTFAKVERHYWWMVEPSTAEEKAEKIQLVKDDVMTAFVGYKTEEKKENMFIGEAGFRSRIVVAPPVPKGKQKCTEELPGYLAQEFFQRHSKEGDWVADLMCGSGSASVAAASIGRNSFAADISKDMVRFLFN